MNDDCTFHTAMSYSLYLGRTSSANYRVFIQEPAAEPLQERV